MAVKVKIVNSSGHPLPNYQTSGAAGMDLHAALKEKVVLEPRARLLIPTGLYLELPHGYEAQLRPRSGWALKHGITIVNSPATIDSDYRGEIQIVLINHGSEDFEIQNGDRIAQMVVAKHEHVEWESVAALESETARGTSGFGHTGK